MILILSSQCFPQGKCFSLIGNGKDGRLEPESQSWAANDAVIKVKGRGAGVRRFSVRPEPRLQTCRLSCLASFDCNSLRDEQQTSPRGRANALCRITGSWKRFRACISTAAWGMRVSYCNHSGMNRLKDANIVATCLHTVQSDSNTT